MKKSILLCALAFCAVSLQSLAVNDRKEPTEQKESFGESLNVSTVDFQITSVNEVYDFDVVIVEKAISINSEVFEVRKAKSVLMPGIDFPLKPDRIVNNKRSYLLMHPNYIITRQTFWLSNFSIEKINALKYCRSNRDSWRC